MAGMVNEAALILAALGGYLLGAVPFGVLITRALGLGDLRRIGSGNIGATNVLRTGNKGAALATVLLDAGKGAVAVWIARYWAGEGAAIIAGLAAFAGHLYPVWLGFRGGKGVATFLGTMLAISWPVGLAACGIWLLVAFMRRISALAALAAAALTPLVALGLGRGGVAAAALVMALLIFWRHRENVARIRAGTEPRIGKGR